MNPAPSSLSNLSALGLAHHKRQLEAKTAVNLGEQERHRPCDCPVTRPHRKEGLAKAHVQNAINADMVPDMKKVMKT